MVRYDGHSADEIARRCDVPRVIVLDEVESTMDVAHRAAADGAPAGTVVIAKSQSAGRGREGRRWLSDPEGSITLTLIERPLNASGVAVLSLRVGMHIARALQRFSRTPIAVKWPNDLLVDNAKVAGILVEVRWREARPEWVAVGVGLNVRESGVFPGAGWLDNAATCDRVDLLAEMVPAIRAACQAEGVLTTQEVSAFAGRDWVRGKQLVQPARGVARGIAPHGALIVDGAHGPVECSTGSLVLAEV